MAFYGHLGSAYVGAGAAALSTYNTILDDMVADIAAAVAGGTNNGWTLYDDQRNLQVGPTAMRMDGGNTSCSGFLHSGGYALASAGGTTLTNAATTVTGSSTQYNAELNPTSFSISFSADGTNWGPNVASVASATSAALASNWTFGTQTQSKTIRYRVTAASGGATYGYIVLKCTSGVGCNNHYLRFTRLPSFGWALAVEAWETWDNVAHTGTNPGPQEYIGPFSGQQTQTTPLAYMLWLLPEVCCFWISGAAVNGGELVYSGNLDPYRGPGTDPNCLVFGCSSQIKSGIFVQSRSAISSGNSSFGGFSINRALVSQGLWGTNASYANKIIFWPRGPTYVCVGWSMPLLDRDLKLQMVGADAWTDVQTALLSELCGKRGAFRHIKIPCGYPSYAGLYNFSAADGNTYIMVKCNMPPNSTSTAGNYQYDASSSTGAFSAFAYNNQGWYGSNFGEVVGSSTLSSIPVHRFLLLPVNL